MTYPIMNFPGNREKALTLSYDDGVEQDAKLKSILDAHGLKCTFNLNSGCYSPEGMVFTPGTIHRRLSEKAVSELYSDPNHEVAVHAVNHPHLESIPLTCVVDEIINDRKNLEKQFGRIVRGMAYPYGTYNDAIVEVLKDCGIVYSRTVETTNNFSIPTDWLRLKATCHHNSQQLSGLTDRFVGDKKAGTAPWLFYLWGHSYEFEQNNNWEVIESFTEKTGGHDDIWYATNIEIYDYIAAYNSLVFSVDAKQVYNPSATVVCFSVGTNRYRIAPGEILKFRIQKELSA